MVGECGYEHTAGARSVASAAMRRSAHAGIQERSCCMLARSLPAQTCLPCLPLSPASPLPFSPQQVDQIVRSDPTDRAPHAPNVDTAAHAFRQVLGVWGAGEWAPARATIM